MATETERTAESFYKEHLDLDDRNWYFRFNVFYRLENISLKDVKLKGAIVAVTRRYLFRRQCRY
jgi:hypothetical protein